MRNWLDEQLSYVKRDARTWPSWMKGNLAADEPPSRISWSEREHAANGNTIHAGRLPGDAADVIAIEPKLRRDAIEWDVSGRFARDGFPSVEAAKRWCQGEADRAWEARS